MFIIMVYDVQQKRVNKVLKKSREYLTWIQNSVLEGELSSAKFIEFKSKIKKIIDKENDSVIFYTFREKTYTGREVLGVEKGSEQIIF
ncbi:MAG: CRISPR-associated endonuclease Cas2 [Spirochaetota bacterium]|nr:CRISPR-associated endonuclease Cas2 [Spirochaetota bacterium]